MPELPDVEVYKQYFDKHSLNKKIKSVDVKDTKVLKTSSNKLSELMDGEKFVNTRRLGKHLLASTNHNRWIAMHFGMTGALQYYQDKEEAPKYGKIIFNFDNGDHLAFINKRKFGYIDIVDDYETFVKDQKLGPDAMDIDLDEFKKIMNNKKGMIKSVLMDQQVISGLGNVYTDEILYQAKLHPKAKLDNLSEDDIKNMHRIMRRVLKTTINNHADPAKLPKHWK